LESLPGAEPYFSKKKNCRVGNGQMQYSGTPHGVGKKDMTLHKYLMIITSKQDST